MPPTQIQLRRDTGANWTSENPILAEGEIGIETDASPVKFKIGDGATAWTSLAYFGGSGPADMTKAVYDTDDDGAVDLAENSTLWNGLAIDAINAGAGLSIRWDAADGEFKWFTPLRSVVVSSTAAGEIATFSDTLGKEIKGSGGAKVSDLTPISGWIADPDTWTRTGNHTYTKSGDHTATHRKGAKVRYKDGGGFEYGVIGSSSHAAGTTTITLISNTDFAMAAATITDTYLSYVDTPEDWPDVFNYAPIYGGFSTDPSGGSNTWTTKGRTCIVYLFPSTFGNSNDTIYTVSAPVTPVASTMAFTRAWNNNAAILTPALMDVNAGGGFTLYTDLNGGGWANTSGKMARATVVYNF